MSAMKQWQYERLLQVLEDSYDILLNEGVGYKLRADISECRDWVEDEIRIIKLVKWTE